MADDEMKHMSIYVSEGVRRRFKALCALQGITLGGKIEQILEREERETSPNAHSAQTTPTKPQGSLQQPTDQ